MSMSATFRRWSQIRKIDKIFRQQTRYFAFSLVRCRQFNKPLTGDEMPRAGGIASMCRLPIQNTAEGLDVCFVGIPLDIGTSFRSGTRHGPRQIRNESSIIGAFNCSTGAAPFESLQIADIGDINLNLYDLKQACNDIREFYRTKVLPYNCVPLTMGGDHTLSYPVLQAIKEKHGAVGMVHIDAHPDTLGTMMGKDVAHGTPFLRSVEEGLLDCNKVITIGLRGHAALPGGDWKVPGFRYVYAQDCWYKSLAPLMEDVRQQMGDTPVYISFDIDALDPAYAPGTGFPEVGGLTSVQVLEIIRGCRGLNVIGADLVEVSPAYDINGMTALIAANFLIEILGILPGVKYHSI